MEKLEFIDGLRPTECFVSKNRNDEDYPPFTLLLLGYQFKKILAI